MRFCRPTVRPGIAAHPVYRVGPRYDIDGAAVYVYEPLYAGILDSNPGLRSQKQYALQSTPVVFVGGLQKTVGLGGVAVGSLFSFPPAPANVIGG